VLLTGNAQPRTDTVQRAIEILQGRDLPKPLVRRPAKQRTPKRDKSPPRSE
jgi:hypothetical protein